METTRIIRRVKVEKVELIPPGLYTVKVVDHRRVEIIEGPYKGCIIVCPIPAFQVNIEQKTVNLDND